MTSLPGSERQDIHSDVVFENDSAKIYTTFVALQDVDETMGPTWIWPGISWCSSSLSHLEGTNNEYFQCFYKPSMLGPVDTYYWKTPHCKMTVKCGDAVLMDTRCAHSIWFVWFQGSCIAQVLTEALRWIACCSTSLSRAPITKKFLLDLPTTYCQSCKIGSRSINFYLKILPHVLLKAEDEFMLE